MKNVDFGPYRATDRTIWRPDVARFEPNYVLNQAVHADLAAVARLDQDLSHYEADEATAHRILRDALTRNAYGTASLGGNPLTLAQVERLLAVAPTPDRAVVPDEREVLQYVDFMRRLDSIPVPRNGDEVKALHRALFEGVLADVGVFKSRPNFVGRRETRQVVFVPTMPELVESELASALAWLHDANEHPLVRVIVFFHEFQSIRPFTDGNGRLGRALAALALWHAGYRGIRYALVHWAFNVDRDSYYGRLDDARAHDSGLTPWVAYMARVLRETFEDAARRFLFTNALPDGLNDRQVRVAEWFARVTRDEPARRVKFADVHAGFPQLARRTLQLDLATLVEARVLDKTGERKGTSYGFVA